jgi:DNA mismatch repair protein MutL
MADRIARLPEHVANQIAAGEVIQRPAAAVKELVENAVDAGASRIEVRIKDAGRTLIQVIDNGEGMTEGDAQRCFERHATSKVRSADDLFEIATKGFRGEALASIAAIAHVELKTRREEAEVGTRVLVEGSAQQPVEPCTVPVGTQFAVRNLFYNVPARRNFLKSDAVEMRHIIDEFQRVALAHETIHFILFHNDTEVFNLKPGTRRQRVVGVFGSKYDERLVPIEESTDVVAVEGFVGKPEFARRTRGEQFLFVNRRFIKHAALHRAIVDAFEGLLSPSAHPLYVLFLTIDPHRVDVNIHPTKVEVKFEEDRSIQALLRPAVRRGLGRFQVAPTLDFDQESSLNIRELMPGVEITPPQVTINPNYNPFESGRQGAVRSPAPAQWLERRPSSASIGAWQEQYAAVELPAMPKSEPSVQKEAPEVARTLFFFRNRFIVTAIRSALLLIDARRAHQRVLYESLVEQLESVAAPASPTQTLLFPEAVDLPPVDTLQLVEAAPWLRKLGLHFEAGADGVEVTGMPLEGESTPKDLIDAVLAEAEGEVEGISREERVAAGWARRLAHRPGKVLGKEEMEDLVDRLFACSTPARDPFGRPVIVTFEDAEILERFR